MNQSKKVTEGALFIAIFFVLMLASFIPILSGFIVFLMPIPFVIYTAKHGWKPGTLVLTVASLITMLFFTIVSLPLTLLMGIGGLMIGQAIYKKRTAYETWAFGILGFVFGLLLTFGFAQLFMGINFIDEFKTISGEQMQIYLSVLESLGESGTEADIQAIFEEQIQFIMTLLPALLIFMAVAIAFLVQWISYKILNRLEKAKLYFPPFREFKLPGSILWLYLLVLVISFFDLDQSGTLYLGIVNGLTILEILLVVQGFSFIFFFAHYRNMSRALPIISIILTVLLPMLLVFFIRILGIIDIGLSLKDRLKAKKENEK